jgi:hypothetical protein
MAANSRVYFSPLFMQLPVETGTGLLWPFNKMDNSVNVTSRGVIQLLFNYLRLSRVTLMDFESKKREK